MTRALLLASLAMAPVALAQSQPVWPAGARTISHIVDTGANSGDLTLGAFGSNPNANGLSLSGQVLSGQPADQTHAGFMSILAQTFAGDKTFAGEVYLNHSLHSLIGNSPLSISVNDNSAGGLLRVTAESRTPTGTEFLLQLMDGSTEWFSMRVSGELRQKAAAMQTCSSSIEWSVINDSTSGGATSHPSRRCVCRSNGTGAVTNILVNPTAPGGSGWTGGSAGGAAAPTVTTASTDVLGPDGQANASKVVFPSVSGSQSSNIQQTFSTVAGQAYTTSVWLLSPAGAIGGNGTVNILNTDSAGAAGTRQHTCVIQATWTRCVFANSVVGTGASQTTIFYLGFNGFAGFTNASTLTVYVADFQVEQTTTASEFCSLGSSTACPQYSWNNMSHPSPANLPQGTATTCAD